MDTNWKITSIFLLLIFLSYGCKTDPKKEYEKAVLEWTGKTIIFPDSMRTIFGEKAESPKSEYTIVAYFDSVGCTSCRLKMPHWKDFMTTVDSIIGSRNAELLIIIDTDDVKKVQHLTKVHHFPYRIILDKDGVFQRVNNIGDSPNLQTFLLDDEHKIIMIGNPTSSNAVKNLYLKRFNEFGLTDNPYSEEIAGEYNFGSIHSNEEVHHVFSKTNLSSDTINVRDLYTSCDCTTASISSTKIAPGDSYTISVTFKDTVIGEFIRSITVKYLDNIPNQTFEISGKITN